MRRGLPIALLGLLLALAAVAAGRQDPLRRVVQNLRRQQAAVASWSAEVRVDIDMPGMRVKGKKVGVRFTAPDSFSFQSKGFALLPKRAFLWTADSLFAGLAEPRLLPARTGDPRGSVRVGGILREDGVMARMDMRVDTLRWVVTRVSAWQDTLEAVRLDHEWFQAAKGVWLPAAVRMRLRFSPEAQRFYEHMRTPLRRRQAPREGGGSVLMTFSKHQMGGRR